MKQKTHMTASGPIVYWVGEPCAAQPETQSEVQAEVRRETHADDGFALVFLPGLTADHRLFDKQIERFESEVRCIVWDAPSHALSRPFALTWTMDDLARYLDEILQIEGVTRPLLVGQSMGGYVSQAYMDLFPDRAVGFVCVDSAPLQKRYYPAWELALLRHTEGMYRSIPWGLLKVWGPSGTAQTAYGRALMRTFMDDYGKVEYCKLAAHGYRVLADSIEADRRYAVDCPAFLICGTKDQAGDVRKFNRAWTKGSGIPMHWIEGAGHNSNADCPDQVNALISQLMEQVR